MEQTASYNPLNPSDPVLPNGVPLSTERSILTQGAVAFLILFILSNALFPEGFKEKMKPAIVVYAILQILLVEFVVVPDKEQKAAAAYREALKPITQRTVAAWYKHAAT